jgi:hypothetical protein
MLKRSGENIHREYVENLIYRYIFSLSDIADRNFLVVNDKVYSVDEEHTGLKLASELKKNKCIYLKKWVSDNYNLLRLDWKINELEVKDKIEKLKNKEFVENLFTEL